MSHHKHERIEKECLNCETTVHGRYCHSCGQENLEPKETVGHIVRHFFEDITHFDGKYFSTLKYLFTKPGYLTGEYINGRKAKYLNPVRMYMFTSAIFFLFLFTFFQKSMHTSPEVAYIRDTIEQNNRTMGFAYETKFVPELGRTIKYFHVDRRYAVNGVHVYDSMQHSLPASARANWYEQIAGRSFAAVATAYHKDPNRFIEKYDELFTHSFTQVFFISLPLFALMLYLLNIRRKGNFYVAHLIFSIHFYCIVFILALIGFLAGYIDQSGKTSGIIFLGAFAYLFIAMLRFYNKGWLRTIANFLVQSVFFTAIFLLLVFVFWVNSLLNVAA